MDLTDEQITKLCFGQTVFANKQALLRWPTAQYHCINNCHLQDYDYVTNVEVHAESRPQNKKVFKGEFIHYNVFGHHEDAVLITQKWDSLLLSNNKGTLPWCPGIMQELTIPLAIDKGFTELIIVGWDMGLGYEHGVPCPHEPKYTIVEWEHNAMVNSSESYYNWLLKNGIQIKLLSTQSSLSDAIPRITLKEAIS